MRRPTVAIAEDDFLIREGCLHPLLKPEFDIVASVDSGEALVIAVQEHRPDVALVDISLPGMRGFEAAQKILAIQPDLKVLFVTNYSEKAYIDEARRIQASGCVLKSRAATQLVSAIKSALSGEFFAGLP